MNYERTHWRDEWISAEHRRWGDQLWWIDVDWCVIEYYGERPVLLVDYIRIKARPYLDPKNVGLKALGWLASCGRIPFIIALYDADALPEPSFEIIPINKIAKKNFGNGRVMGRREYVTLLYELRKIVMNNYIRRKLDELEN